MDVYFFFVVFFAFFAGAFFFAAMISPPLLLGFASDEHMKPHSCSLKRPNECYSVNAPGAWIPPGGPTSGTS